ncbi:MAG: lactate racemase domain-containing protein [Lachnospiraceae bacterium]|nr:lactate racemase domain-containing protein [Lachnospiraceae bacterium]
MENVTSRLLEHVSIPKMFQVRQIFSGEKICPEEIPGIIRSRLIEKPFSDQIKPGMKIAITVGSRQIANIITITKTIVDFVKEKGASPFIVASMGSHGGATAEGQREILKNFGITEESMGCPIKCNMTVVKIGVNEEGMDVLIGKDAAEADGIIINCRIKPHTCFRGPYESGIMKMMTIGLGKQAGAEVCHEAGFGQMAKYIPMFGRAILKHANILFSVAVLENAYDETAKIVVLNHDEIEAEEPKLLEEAKSLLPRIQVPECDVLICDVIGKNFSGSGMDPNITGTFVTPYASGGLKSQRVAILDLSKESHHSGCGMGMAHATTRRFFDKLDFDLTYPNLITSTVVENARIPMVLKNDKEAIQVCIRTCTGIDKQNIRIVRIANSLKIEHIMLSEAYYEEAKANPGLVIESEPEELQFDQDGNLIGLGAIG